MKTARTIALGLVWVAAATPLCLSAVFLGGRLLIRELHGEGDGGGRLQAMSIPVSALEWYEKDRELLIDGRMFDVKSIKVEAGVARVTGFFDDLETQLNRALEDTGGTGQPGMQSGWRLFQSCLGMLGICAEAFRPHDGPALLYANPSPGKTAFRICEGHRRIPVPPPQHHTPGCIPDIPA